MNSKRRTFLKTAGSAVAIGAFGGAGPLAMAGAPPPTHRAADDLCFESARELARLIRQGKLSARELMSAYLRQIARLNPRLNAIVAKLDDARCLALADA